MTDTHYFWLLFFVLNSFYFIPRFVLEYSRTNWLPVQGLLRGTPYQRLRTLFIRLNYDIFRCCTDFLILTGLYIFLLRDAVSVIAFSIILSAYFGLSLLYQIYHTTFDKLYHLEPVLFNDGLMLKTALQIFFHEYDLKNFFITIAGIVFGAGVIVLIYHLLAYAQVASFGMGSTLIFGILGPAGMFSMLHYGYKKYPRLGFQSPLQAFIRNVRLTAQVRRDIEGLTVARMKKYNVDPAIRLTTRPNVWLVIVESYGRIMMDHPGLSHDYNARMQQLDHALSEAGWHACSGLTLPPVTGGASWISYTSIMFGLNVKNQGVFRTMVKNTRIAEYDSLFHWLRRNGYTSYRISSLGGYEKMEIPYAEYSRLYGIDHWIRYKDLNFKGKQYGFGPSPPDQFSINRAADLILERPGPFAAFFISQNSHTPYDSPHEPAVDWTTLIDADYTNNQRSLFWSKPQFENYGAAILYQMQYLTDFMVRRGSERDIFILVGDHQPPSLSVSIDTFETPIHIVSKDQSFVDALASHGLHSGFAVRNTDAHIRQEAIHWALLRALIATYGDPPGPTPAFLKHGIPYA